MPLRKRQEIQEMLRRLSALPDLSVTCVAFRGEVTLDVTCPPNRQNRPPR